MKLLQGVIQMQIHHYVTCMKFASNVDFCGIDGCFLISLLMYFYHRTSCMLFLLS